MIAKQWASIEKQRNSLFEQLRDCVASQNLACVEAHSIAKEIGEPPPATVKLAADMATSLLRLELRKSGVDGVAPTYLPAPASFSDQLGMLAAAVGIPHTLVGDASSFNNQWSHEEQLSALLDGSWHSRRAKLQSEENARFKAAEDAKQEQRMREHQKAYREQPKPNPESQT